MTSKVKMPDPDAYLFQHEETGLVDIIDAQQVEWGFEKNNPRWKCCGEMYSGATLKAYADAKVKEALERAAKMIEPTNPKSDWTKYAHDCAEHAALIRALAQEQSK